MQNNNDVIAGLASSVFQDSEAKFQKEQDFGHKLFIAAWAVELMAALLGLLIAGFVAFDAYSQNSDENGNSVLNAITGALPFALIAVIELTKIPLATGLYRVRNWAWKIFILIALLALMLVTFETMFTGLERQMTNITARITDKKTEIQRLESQVSENERQITQIISRDVEAETADITDQISQVLDDGEQKISSLNASHEKVVTDIEEQLKSKLDNKSDRQLTLQTSVTSRYDTAITSANERINRLEEELSEIDSQFGTLEAGMKNEPAINKLELRNVEIQKRMEEAESLLSSSEEAQIKQGQVRIGVRPDGRFGGRTRRFFVAWRAEQEARINANNTEIENSKTNLRADLARVQVRAKNKREDRDTEVRNRQTLEEERANANSALISTPPTPELQLINEGIKQSRSALQKEKEKHTGQAERIRSETQAAVDLLTNQRSQISENINAAKQRLDGLQISITALKAEIVTIQNTIRKDARNNQVYRFAQKWGGKAEDGKRKAYEDILQVTEKDLTRVGAVWFGSIAIICATIGTVLALIANIMTDPDAFVQKEKSRKVKPVMRGLRLLFLVVRRKLLKRPEIVELERVVEIEKLVEVEKIVEVEKEIEKLVPEIIPIPIFIPSDADHEAEMSKASKYYDAINKSIDDAVKRGSE